MGVLPRGVMRPAGSELGNLGILLFDNEDGWELWAWGSKDDMSRDTLTGDESFITHACSQREWTNKVYIFPDTHKNCWRCTAPVPDGIRALWIMHNGAI